MARALLVELAEWEPEELEDDGASAR